MKTDPETFKLRYGKWGIVAGASEGLGASFSDRLAARGLDLVLVARREGLLEERSKALQEKYGICVKTLPLDLSQPEAAGRIAAETSGLEVGMLVFNAAFSAIGPFADRPLADHLTEVDTNTRAPLILTHVFGRRMLAQGHGGIVLLSSLSAFQGSAFISNYSATKAYNLLLAEGLWEEWRPRGVDVLACIAGATRTPNYLASAPRQTGRFSDATLAPEVVAEEALEAVGRRPFVIPGRSNRFSSFVMRHLMPRKAAIRLMGRILRGMYTAE